jgi:hypothetical protein
MHPVNIPYFLPFELMWISKQLQTPIFGGECRLWDQQLKVADQRWSGRRLSRAWGVIPGCESASAEPAVSSRQQLAAVLYTDDYNNSKWQVSGGRQLPAMHGSCGKLAVVSLPCLVWGIWEWLMACRLPTLRKTLLCAKLASARPNYCQRLTEAAVQLMVSMGFQWQAQQFMLCMCCLPAGHSSWLFIGQLVFASV